MDSQKGFTLTEWVLVAIIIGILAAVAMPKFTHLSGNAEQASLAGIAGSLGEVAAINYATCAATMNVPVKNQSITVDSCLSVVALVKPELKLGPVGPAQVGLYNILSNTAVKTNGLEVDCILQFKTKHGVVYTAKYMVIGACNVLQPTS